MFDVKLGMIERMRAFTLDGFEEQPRLRDDLPEPRPGARELLVRVHASSVNGVDVFIATGGLRGMAEHEFPATIGRDFAGVVEDVGGDVTSFTTGDEVFGFVPQLLDSGALRVPIRRYPLEAVGEALQAFAETQRQGKLRVMVAT